MFDNKNMNIGRLILTLLMLAIVITSSTFAWFTYQSRQSALVLSIGDIKDSKVIIKPYQIRETLTPVNVYTSGVYSQVTAINNTSNMMVVDLFYKVNELDESIINNGFKYTIVSSDSENGTYEEVVTDDFTGILNNELKILNVKIEPETTTYYKVYIWLDSGVGNQTELQNTSLDIELNGVIGVDANKPVLDEGMIPVTISDTGVVTTVSESDSNWYDYSNQKWANIVLVNSGNTDSQLYDLSGNNTENTINGAKFNNSGLDFDGLDDFVLLPEISLSSMSQFTFEVEFSTNLLSEGEKVLIYNANGGGGGLFLWNSALVFGLYSSDNSSYINVTSGERINAGEKYLVTGVYDGSTIKLYVNGVLKATKEFSYSIGDPVNNTHYTLGCNPNGSVCKGSYFEGTMYSARFYEKALSTEEISGNYNDNVTNENLLFRYDFVNGKRALYKETTGKTVVESDILAYYTWIPRYKYKIWTTSTGSSPQEIDILFETKNEPMLKGTMIGSYRTHPAFWWDVNSDGEVTDYEMLPGIWVGKFETTGDVDTPTVLPNTSSLTNQNVSAQFTTSLKFAGGTLTDGDVRFDGSSIYGLTTNTDSHMMKNSEWGAVAYLSHSAYGINEEVRINNYNNSGTLTGCGASTIDEAESTTCGIVYGSPSSEENTYPQSTTGNITGIFDVSGGSLEYVMGHYGNIIRDTDGSGFSLLPNSKYYDLYSDELFTGDLSTYNTLCTLETCGGHSLYETKSWYSQYTSFISEDAPWFMRSGYYGHGKNAGMFYADGRNGTRNDGYGFRSVLIPVDTYEVVFDMNGYGDFVSEGEYIYTAPISGKYQLEVWGAQGGYGLQNGVYTTGTGGYGGYSIGTILLTAGQNLYVNVGGKGGDGIVNINASGGYNGGGNSYWDGSDNESSGGGGGATHIATDSGLLSSFKDSTDKLLIVAGGGGGGAWNNLGGSGGGYMGTIGYNDENSQGTQTTGYAFGQGGEGTYRVNTPGGGGGGGGYYGGLGGQATDAQTGSGGSGYIGSSLLTNKVMYCYNCTTSSDDGTLTYSTTNVSDTPTSNYAKSGGGAAKITSLDLITKSIAYNSTYGELPTLTRMGYTFNGWNTKADGSGEVVTTDTLMNTKSDHTLYAVWQANTYTISYNANGGSGAPANQTKIHGDDLTLSTTTPTKSGYTFLGWSTSSGAVSATYAAGGSYTSNASTTLYAVWKLNTYTITYDANGGIIKTNSYTSATQHTYSVSTSGKYKLEVWGAQGGTGVTNGTSKYVGGYGGYSVGIVSLTSGNTLYINVGGKGTDATDSESGGTGGYNGGGKGGTDGNYSSSGGNEPGAGGGGATHIATRSGLLSALSSYKSNILIAAGGGGGGAYDSIGGHGGGIQGTYGTASTTTVGTQTSGNAFGLGGTGITANGGGGGGGGGYYGGGGGAASGDSGGGGSGYIANSLLSNKYMYCYNCTTSSTASTLTYSTTSVSSTAISNNAKSGNGAARISQLTSTVSKTYGSTYGALSTPTKTGYTFVGWNTKADGTGTTITSSSKVSIVGNHTLYAIWKAVETLYLYTPGDECTNVTGGWGQVSHSSTSYWNDGTITRGTDGITLKGSTSSKTSGRFAGIITNNTIDLTGFSKLYINVLTRSMSGDYRYTYVSVLSKRVYQASNPNLVLSYNIPSTGLIEIDVSGISGEYYIGVTASGESESSATLKFNQIYLK